jgi:hypothetical protein
MVVDNFSQKASDQAVITGNTLRRKDEESKVMSLHFAESSGESLLELQTVPETETIQMLMRSATNSAMPLSKRKNLQAS